MIYNKVDFSIKRAGLEEVELLHCMACEVFPHTYKEILSEEQIKYMMHWMYDVESLRRQMLEQHHQYFIAYFEEEAVGYLSIRPDGDDCFHLEKIYVLPDFQHRHYGGEMFDFAVDYVRTNYPHVHALELNVNRYNSALDFYLKKGMKIDRQGDFDIGNGFYMNDYIMRLEF